MSELRFAAAALLALCSCAASGSRAQPRLPFHVAVIPIVTHVDAQTSVADDELRLTVDARRLELLLIDELERRCLAHATLLAAPEDAAAFASASPQERDAYWLESSVAIGADLVLECELEFRPAVEHARNEKFWLNLPLFLLGGPACYFVDDRTYRAHAALRGRLLDLNPVVAGRADLEDGLSELADLEARFEATSLDFIDRTERNPAAYATSLLVPSGFLARDNQAVQQSLAEHAEGELVQGLADALMEQSSALLLAESVASFHLDPALRVVREGDLVRISGDVILRRGEVERLDVWSLFAGARVVHGGFGPSRLDIATESLRHPLARFGLDAQIVVDDDVREVRLEIAEAGPNPSVRSFTFVLDQATASATRRGSH